MNIDGAIGPLIGGLLAIAGGLLVSLSQFIRERRRWQRDARIRSGVDLLAALQTLMRRTINLAYVPAESPKSESTTGRAAIDRYEEATIAWNSAKYAVMLVTPGDLTAMVDDLDSEFDRLLDLAMKQQFTREQFREERKELGRMAARYLNMIRRLTDQPALDKRSIWTWDGG